jgi:serine/threonine protein kinase
VVAPTPDRFMHPRYSIRRELAHGSYSVVYEAVPIHLADRPVALKVLRDREYIGWFFRIARVIASLNHTGIVPCYEVGEVKGRQYVALAFIPGEDLRYQIAARGSQPAGEVVRVIRDVAAALDYAHGRGIIHGHLHPKHILLDAGGFTRLIGFGEYPLPGGAVLGNPLHLAPEQFSSAGPLTTRTDVYALAETAYWMLCGKHPYHSENFEGSLAMKSSGLHMDVCGLRPDLPPRPGRGIAEGNGDQAGGQVRFGDRVCRSPHLCHRRVKAR